MKKITIIELVTIAMLIANTLMVGYLTFDIASTMKGLFSKK